jgi:hypothetical protein
LHVKGKPLIVLSKFRLEGSDRHPCLSDYHEVWRAVIYDPVEARHIHGGIVLGNRVSDVHPRASTP